MASPTHQSSAAPFGIDAARPDDSEEIYGLLTQAFGATYLKFTIYQSPLATTYLREIVEATAHDSGRAFYVYRQPDGLAGFYDAVRRDDSWFLNYVAVGTHALRAGIGRQLLAHFEAQAPARGCRQLALDVFESNTAVVNWYLRHGYVARDRRYHARLPLAELPAAASADAVRIDPTLLAAALEEEGRRGFSRVTGEWRNQDITVGLVAGTTCNLLDIAGSPPLDVAAGLARRMGGERQWILLAATAPIGGEVGGAFEVAIRMDKAVSLSGDGVNV